jgi:hypothetical protein
VRFTYPLRSVDILPTVLREMGIPAQPGLNGHAVTLRQRRGD